MTKSEFLWEFLKTTYSKVNRSLIHKTFVLIALHDKRGTATCHRWVPYDYRHFHFLFSLK